MSYFFKKQKDEENPNIPDEATVNREKQKGFFDELLRLPGQKQKLRLKGFDFARTFDENYDDGFRLYENPKSAPETDKMQALSFKSTDSVDEPANEQDSPTSDSSPETALPIFEKRDVYTKDEINDVRSRTGDGDYPDWYLKSLKPIYDEIDAAKEAGDTEREAAANNGLSEINQKYSEYENYPDWAKYYMDEYTDDYINNASAKHGYGYAPVLFGGKDVDYDSRMDNAMQGGEALRRELAFRDELYGIDQTLGETYDSLMNEKVNAIKIYKRAIEYGNQTVASNAKRLINTIDTALGKLNDYYKTRKNPTDEDSWIGYYDNKTRDEIFYSELGSILAQTEEEKDMYQSSSNHAERSREDYEEKLTLREEIEKNAPDLLADFDKHSNDYLKAEKDYYEAIENGDTAKAQKALARMDEAHANMDALKVTYEEQLEQAKIKETENATPADGEGIVEYQDYSLTNTSAHIPTVPRYVNSQNQRSADNYRQVVSQFDVVNNPRYARRNGYTYCNIYVWDVISAMGAPLPYWVRRDNAGIYMYDTSLSYSENAKYAYQLDANGMCKWLENSGPTYGWSSCNASKAQKMANEGHPVIATWYNANGIGHVAVVVPKNEGDNSDSVVISQAGASNYSYTTVSKGFGNRKVKYYYHD